MLLLCLRRAFLTVDTALLGGIGGVWLWEGRSSGRGLEVLACTIDLYMLLRLRKGLRCVLVEREPRRPRDFGASNG